MTMLQVLFEVDGKVETHKFPANYSFTLGTHWVMVMNEERKPVAHYNPQYVICVRGA